MRELLELTSSPVDEPCVQVSADRDYIDAMRAECRAYRNQLIRVFGEPPFGASLIIKSNAHDFGTYMEVACRYDGDEGAEYAYNIEANPPTEWDEAAREELAANEAWSAYTASGSPLYAEREA